MRSFFGRRPLLSVILAGIGFFLCHYLWYLFLPFLPEIQSNIYQKITAGIYVLILIFGLGWQKDIGLAGLANWRKWLPFLPLLFLPLLMLIFNDFLALPVMQILGFALVALMTGFGEEVLFRGITVRALLPNGTWKAAIYSALIFGVLHVVNLLKGADPVATGLQIITAIFFGFAVAAPRLYTGAIWPAIVIHGIQDILAFWSTGSIVNNETPATADILLSIGLMLPLVGYGIWLLRKQIKADKNSPVMSTAVF